MGALSTKLFRDILEEEENEPSTPVSSKKKMLPMEFDPRSPSSDITRTPIQVEKTPDLVIDPRSPTNGIARTPIYSRDQQSKHDLVGIPICPNMTVDSLSDKSTPSNFTADSETDNFTADSETDDSPLTGFEELELLSRSSSEPDLSSLKDEETELLKEKLAPVSLSYKESSPLRYRAKKLFVGHTNAIPADESPRKSEKMSQKSEKNGNKNQRSPLMVIDGQRSPLSVRNVDVNSPRAIVQRKQMNKVGLMRTQVNTNSKQKGSPSKFKLFSDDKENL